MKRKLSFKGSLLARVVAAVLLANCAAMSTMAFGDSAPPTYGDGNTYDNTPRVTSNQTQNLPRVVNNGNFETGDFTGWNTVEAGNGRWVVYTGTILPDSGNAVPAPPEGVFAASTDQLGPGSHILLQDLTLGAGAQTLSFVLYYNNLAGTFVNPPHLDHTLEANQQYRVDIMNPAAPVDSVAPGDVLANVFQTTPASSLIMVPTLMTFDLTPFAGQTIRLRFAEVDNLFFFPASVDDVRIGPLIALHISPPSGNYVTTQGVDLALIIEASGLSVVGGRATLDGSDVTAPLVRCVIPGTLVSGGQTFRCPGLRGGIVRPGTHTLNITLNLNDGSSVSDSVTWKVLDNTEP